MAINKKWHEQHKMPKNATLVEKLQWHIAHEKNCSCRPMPETLRAQMKKKSTIKNT